MFKQSHYHILLKCFDSHTQTAVRKWFYRFRFSEIKDVDGSEQECLINTHCHIVDSISEAVDYLTHENDADKYHYSKSDIIQFGQGWSTFYSAGRKIDVSSEIIDKLSSGYSLRSMVSEYGKDFVYHYSQYRTIAFEIRSQELNAQKYLDVCNACFSSGTDTLIDARDFDSKKRIDHFKYNLAVEIVNQFENSIYLFKDLGENEK